MISTKFDTTLELLNHNLIHIDFVMDNIDTGCVGNFVSHGIMMVTLYFTDPFRSCLEMASLKEIMDGKAPKIVEGTIIR